MPTTLELGQKVKAKYPGVYDDLPDIEVGNRTKAKYPEAYADFTDAPVQAEKKKSIFKKAGKFLGDATGIGGIIKIAKEGTSLYKPGGLINQETGRIQQPFNVAGIKQAVGTGAKLGLTAATLGGGTAITGAGRVAQASGIGAGFGVAQGLEDNQSAGGIAKSGLVGAVTGAATGGLIEGGRAALNKVPQLLSHISDTPRSVLQRNFDDPRAMSQATKYVKNVGPEGVLKDTQGAVRSLRTTLSQQYSDGKKAVIALNHGTRASLDTKTQSLLKKVADDFKIDLPSNMNNLSVKEAIALNEEINSVLGKGRLAETAEGVVLRKAKEALGVAIKGPKARFKGVSELLSNYADEKTTLDAADMLVKAYKTGNPVSQRTALSRLLAVYNENAPSFLSAMRALEAKTGVPIMDKLAALKSSNTDPASNVMRSETVVSAVKSIFRTFSDDLSRGAGRGSRFLEKVGPGASKAFSALGGVTLNRKRDQ